MSKMESVPSAESLPSKVRVSLSITPIETDEQGLLEDFSASCVIDESLALALTKSFSEWLSTFQTHQRYVLWEKSE